MTGIPRIVFLRQAAWLSKLIGVNILVFMLVFLCLEFGARCYSYLVNGRDFFRQNTFVTPWITTYDYPPPLVKENGEFYFRNRNESTSIIKPANAIRIIAVGGSTTVNENAFAQTGVDYSIALEKRLTAAINSVNVEVLNAGGDAYSTAHSLINIQFRLIEFNPDIILLMHNINDCSVNFFGEGATPDYSNKYLKSYFLNPSLQGTLSIPGFLTQFRFLAKFGFPKFVADERGDLNPEADYSGGIHFFRRNIASIAEICRENRVRLILLSQPYSMKPHPFVSQSAFLAYDQVIAEMAKGKQIKFVDMFSKFGHEERYFVDQFHYSPQGIDRFSDILFSELKPIIEEMASES